jgi:hypothetical protein
MSPSSSSSRSANWLLCRAERVWCAVGGKDVGGTGVLNTLGDGATTGGAGIGVGAAITLGGDAGVVADNAVHRALVRSAIGLSSDGGCMRRGARGGGANVGAGSMCTLGSDCTLGGVAGGVKDCCSCAATLGVDASGGCCNVEKIERRLSIAWSWLSVLVGVRSAWIAVVRAQRQWMMRSLVVIAGRVSV